MALRKSERDATQRVGGLHLEFGHLAEKGRAFPE